MLGYPNPEILEISQFCKENNIYLIEDTAWGLGAEVCGKKLGTFGDIGCFSFDYAKTITCGEAYVLLMTLFLPEYSICQLTMDDTKFSPNGRLFDPHQFFGFNFRLSEFSAAIISRQLTVHIINHQRSLASVAAEFLPIVPVVVYIADTPRRLMMRLSLFLRTTDTLLYFILCVKL